MAHSQEDITNASNKLEYHISMYVKTYRWLRQKEKWDEAGIFHKAFNTLKFLPRSIQWLVPIKYRNLASNSVEDSHLVQARLLYEFLAKPKQKRFEKTDLRAADFHKHESDYTRLVDDDLAEWYDIISSRGFHLTTKHLTVLISDFEWPFDEIAKLLIKPLREFLKGASDTKLRKVDREQSIAHLELLESLLA